MTSTTSRAVWYTFLSRESDDRHALHRTRYDTPEAARAAAEEFDRDITHPPLRERWLPTRIVKVVLTITNDIEEVET